MTTKRATVSRVFFLLVWLLSAKLAAAAEEQAPSPPEPAPAEQAGPATEPAGKSEEGFSFPSFQIGADAFGGLPMAGTEFIAGVNATIVFPVLEFLWVGLRPALHYSYRKDSVYESTWIHPDVAVQVNILHEPLRVYGLLAGGYMGALDSDLHRGLADGWSMLTAAGVAWKFDGPLGLFIELGFRSGSASGKETVLELDPQGHPQCADVECQSYQKTDVTRTLSLYVFTVNLGLCYTP